MLMEHKDAIRVLNSILSTKEKEILIRIARKLPSWINSDHLTWLGLFGAVISGVGYFLSNWGDGFLWLSSMGFVINWFGDSLDGTLARIRNRQRPVYGFFLDHNIDGITAFLICIGAGTSPYVSFSSALLLLAGYYLLSIFTYINTYLKGEFKISYGNLGPTELRIVIILINTLFIIMPDRNYGIDHWGVYVHLYDYFVLGIALILFGIFFFNFLKEKKRFGKIDPPHKA
jgi:phosphatidylglycerophosphate synthase